MKIVTLATYDPESDVVVTVHRTREGALEALRVNYAPTLPEGTAEQTVLNAVEYEGGHWFIGEHDLPDA